MKKFIKKGIVTLAVAILALSTPVRAQIMLKEFKPLDFYQKHLIEFPINQSIKSITDSCVLKQMNSLPDYYSFIESTLHKDTLLSEILQNGNEKYFDVNIALFYISQFVANQPNGENIDSKKRKMGLARIGNAFFVKACEKVFVLNVFWSESKQSWIIHPWDLSELVAISDYANNLKLKAGVNLFYSF